MDLRTTLRYMGVPVGQSYMLGDNESVVNSAMIPTSRLNKRHTALSSPSAAKPSLQAS
jgi:hypothetical protein